MKRFLALFLACLLILPATLAEDIDLSSMTYDELVKLQKKVSKEMAGRPEQQGYNFPAGVYYSGCGVPDGLYILTSSYGGGAAYIYKSYEAFLNGEEPLNRAWVVEGKSYSMNIHGDVCFVLEFPSFLTGKEWDE